MPTTPTPAIPIQLPELPTELLDSIRNDIQHLADQIDQITRVAEQQDAHWLYAQDLHDYLTQAAEELTRLQPTEYDYDRAKLLNDIHDALTHTRLRGAELHAQQQAASVCIRIADDGAQLLEQLQQGDTPDPDQLSRALSSYRSARKRHRSAFGHNQPDATGLQQDP